MLILILLLLLPYSLEIHIEVVSHLGIFDFLSQYDELNGHTAHSLGVTNKQHGSPCPWRSNRNLLHDRGTVSRPLRSSRLEDTG
jgi:hypothetical protein